LSDVKRLSGVVGVTNGTTIRGPAAPTDVKAQIEEAFGRQAVLQTDVLNVLFQDGTIILSGKVHSWAGAPQRDESPGKTQA
jgi:osmotically-inducible protein OsmY